MKRTVYAVAVLSVALLAVPVQADDVTLTSTWIGAMQSKNYTNQGEPGYLMAMTPGLPGTGQFGMMWNMPVKVTEFTLTQVASDVRLRPQYVHIYTSPTAEPILLKLDNTQDTRTYKLPAPIYAVNSYLMVVPLYDAQHPVYPGVSGNQVFGIMDFHFTATPIKGAVADENLNAGLTIGVNRNPDAGGNLGLLTTGQDIFDNGSTSQPYWLMTSGPALELTATYAGDPRTVGSIGLAFAGDEWDRACPKYVDVYINGDDSTSVRVYIGRANEKDDPTFTQYGRYYFDTPFTDVESLTVVLPNGVADAWWCVLPRNPYVGVREFQAFTPRPPIPEPATLTLLALGSLAIWRRGRR